MTDMSTYHGWKVAQGVVEEGDPIFGGHIGCPKVVFEKKDRHTISTIGRIGIDPEIMVQRTKVDAAWQDVEAADPTIFPGIPTGLRGDEPPDDPRVVKKRLMDEVEAYGRGELGAISWPVSDASRGAWKQLLTASQEKQDAEAMRSLAAGRKYAREMAALAAQEG